MSHRKEPRTPGGIRLRALRESCGKTQLDVELDANLGIGYLQRLELGKVQHPERETLERILSTLNASFMQQREVLELFGYAVPISIPSETEAQWAIGVFQSEVSQDTMPAYLLDSAQRLLAWNSLVPKLFNEVNREPRKDLITRLIFDPISGIAASIVNAEPFFSTQMRIFHYEMQRSGQESWYNTLISEMRQYKVFDEYWIKQSRASQPQVPMRPVARLQLDTGHGLANFRLICEPFAQDYRFRVIHYIPADTATIYQCLQWQS
jgi:transcriptional regulator with XRE-family HTH domain